MKSEEDHRWHWQDKANHCTNQTGLVVFLECIFKRKESKQDNWNQGPKIGIYFGITNDTKGDDGDSCKDKSKTN